MHMYAHILSQVGLEGKNTHKNKEFYNVNLNTFILIRVLVPTFLILQIINLGPDFQDKFRKFYCILEAKCMLKKTVAE